MKSKIIVCFALSVVVTPCCARADTGTCPDLTPPVATQDQSGRRLIGDDLIRLRDIGPLDDPGNSGPSPITISPDGRNLAFQLRRADIKRNTYCLGIYVLDLKTRTLIQVDRGGELISAGLSNFGMADFHTGIPSRISPKWSPDGRHIAFLKRTNSRTEVWLATMGGNSTPLTNAATDVDDFAWSDTGNRLTFATRPALANFSVEVRDEADRGYHYDVRSDPSQGVTPMLMEPITSQYQTIDLVSGAVTLATSAEVGRLTANVDPRLPKLARNVAFSRTGAIAWVAPSDDQIGATSITGNVLSVRTLNGQVVKCRDVSCAGRLDGVWWSSTGKELRFLRREGWANSQTALYRWNVGQSKPQRVFATDDVLASCQATEDELICLHESSTTPRSVVRVAPRTGQIDEVFDPNPEFQNFSRAAVVRLRWRNDVGLETIGDLVMPTEHEPGQKHPLIVAQYITRGFLRGGTGDEYPIQWLANNGYVVLSFQRPSSYIGLVKPTDPIESMKAETKDWADRRSVQSSLEIGIQMVLARGIIDPGKIGITGLSDGSSTASFAVINSNRYAAVSLSTCCVDRTSLLLAGEATSKGFEAVGYPTYANTGNDFWKSAALSSNADKVPPLLLQLSEDEYLHALATYTTLKEFKRPVDLFVFPGEHHIKAQPVHRSNIYKRNLAWFDFWFKGLERNDLVPGDELSHWKEMAAH